MKSTGAGLVVSDTIVQILDFRAVVKARPATLAALRAVFPGTGDIDDLSALPPAVTIDVSEPDPVDQLYRVRCSGAERWRSSDPDSVVGAVESAVTSEAIQSIGMARLLIHGGAVARGTCGLIFPANPGSGKTTLVAGLLRAGFSYLSDEVIVVDPTTHRLLPFARALCIKGGSLQVLEHLYPGLSDMARYRRFGSDLATYLPPPPGVQPNDSVMIRHVILPRYLAGAQTRLEPIPRSVALKRLLEQSFNARRRGPQSVDLVVALLRDASCWSLSIGSLPEAIAAIQNMGAEL